MTSTITVIKHALLIGVTPHNEEAYNLLEQLCHLIRLAAKRLRDRKYNDPTYFLAVARDLLFRFPIPTPLVISTIVNCYSIPFVPGMQMDALSNKG
ncbi:MAG TPA: hypothetical protein VFY26_16925 [Anaerolineales bacterium]|nr:hypothetical protein [Anaerolineales bacterium]